MSRVSIAIARCHLQRDRFLRWAIGRPIDETVDRAVVVRMDEANDEVLDYFVLPLKTLRRFSLLLGEKKSGQCLRDVRRSSRRHHGHQVATCNQATMCFVSHPNATEQAIDRRPVQKNERPPAALMEHRYRWAPRSLP